MLVARNLTFQYPDTAQPVLKGVSFSATSGDRIVLVGQNGSGKSTFARMLGGLLPVQRGELLFNSIPFTQLQGSLRPISLLQRFDELFLATRVDRELAVNFELAGLPSDDITRRVKEQAERFSVTHLLSCQCQLLSPGERLRVALAAQLSRTAPLVVIDEADAFLDQPGRELLREVTKSLAKSGSIVFRVTHDLNSIDDEERLFLIQDGELTESINSYESRTKLISDTPAPVSKFDSLHPSGTPPANEKREISRLTLDACSFSPADGLEVGPFSLELEGDCWTGLSGPNGSGKTLLGKFLAGMYLPKFGSYRVHFSSQAVVDAHTILTNSSHVGYLPAEPERFLIAATVEECFVDSAADLSLRFWSRHFDFDLNENGSRDPLSLSGGEQRRLALLMSLQFDPAFIVLDEPTANLDFNGRASVLSFLKMWKTHGRGGLLISHDQELLQSSCDRMLTLG